MKFEIPTKEVHVLMYRDKDARSMSGMHWNSYSFDTEEEMQEMIDDINDPTSAWRNDAVTIVITKAVVPAIEVEDDFSLAGSPFLEGDYDE